MASNSDTESSTASSGVGENSNTISNPLPPPPPPGPTNHFKCFDCSCSFPTRAALNEHQREIGTCPSQMRSNMNRSSTFLNQLIRGSGTIQSPQSATMALPQPSPRANPSTSRLALAPSPSSLRHNNAAGNGTRGSGYLKRYHPYMRQENIPICPGPPGGNVDRGSSPERKTLDLISQLDPTQNLLSQLERQPARQSVYGANVANAAPGSSKGKGILDLNLNL